jgi:hypothetical protein
LLFVFDGGQLVLASAKWIIAELVRLFHGLDTSTAQSIVEAIISREVPTVWEVNGQKRVLIPKLTMKDKTLLLLYSHTGGLEEARLLSWVEHSNGSVYRRDVLRRCHRDKLIEYDQTAKTVEISPTGISYVETNLPLALTM